MVVVPDVGRRESVRNQLRRGDINNTVNIRTAEYLVLTMFATTRRIPAPDKFYITLQRLA